MSTAYKLDEKSFNNGVNKVLTMRPLIGMMNVVVGRVIASSKTGDSTVGGYQAKGGSDTKGRAVVVKRK